MGLGYAISEDMPMENGRPLSTRLRKMGVLRAREMPEVEVIGVEVPDIECDAHVWSTRVLEPRRDLQAHDHAGRIRQRV